MTRLENNPLGQGNELKKMIESEAKRLRPRETVIKKRACLSCFNCLIIIVVVFGAIGSCGAFALSKSGLVFVPLFSSWFYQEPQPIYTIPTVKEGDSIDWEQKINSSPRRGSKIDLEVSDVELTQLLKEGLREVEFSGQNFKAAVAQVGVETFGLEIFSQLEKPRKVFLTVDIVPSVEDNQWNFSVQKVMVGNLAVPKSIGSLISQTLNNKINSTWRNLPLLVDSIILRHGKILIKASLKQ